MKETLIYKSFNKLNQQKIKKLERSKILYTRTKTNIILCLKNIIFWNILFHLFAWANQLISHDSMGEFDAGIYGNHWKIELGRIVVPIYRKFTRGDLTSSWIVGILITIYLSISLYLIIDIFEIKKKKIIFLIAGILVGNLTMISMMATFIHDADCNIFALLMAVLAVYYWNKENIKSILSIFFLTISIGIYQSYISVTIVLIIMKLMLNILEGEKLDITLKKGVKGIIILIGGGLFYAILMKLIQKYYSITIYSGGYNSVDKFFDMSFTDYLQQMYYAYAGTILILFDSIKISSVLTSRIIHILLLSCLLPILYFFLKQKNIELKEKVLFIFLGLLLPLAMNICQVLTKGDAAHTLMHYAIWLTYIFILIILDKELLKLSRKFLYYKHLIVGNIVIIIFLNMLTANDIYVKKYMEKDATVKKMNSLIYNLEKMDGYIFGKTKVVFIGTVNYLFQTEIDYKRYREIFGVEHNNIMAYNNYRPYFKYILHYPINWVTLEEEIYFRELKEVNEMKSYPQKESIKIIDGILIVKFDKK